MISRFTNWRKQRRGHGISLLVPFHDDPSQPQRAKNWEWLRQYWEAKLPGAEIIIGRDYVSETYPSIPFSKALAVNNAAARSTGDIFVIVDADGYVPFHAVLTCAEHIQQARKAGHKLWYVPYRQFYRLTEKSTACVTSSAPDTPLGFSCPPPDDVIQNSSGSGHGHWYGALIQIMPREAFEEVGGWDPRFRGWGGEDHAAMRATDTLYWPHKTLPGQVLHLWHPMLGPAGAEAWVDWRLRMWGGQSSAGANDALSGRYYGAHGDATRMRNLVDEGRRFDWSNEVALKIGQEYLKNRQSR